MEGLVIDKALLPFPVTLIGAVVFVIGVWLLSRSGWSSVVRVCTAPMTAVVLLAVMALMMAVEGTWQVRLHTTWPFVVVTMMLMVTLAVTVLTGYKKRSVAFELSHAGLLVVLMGAVFGAPDVVEGQMPVDGAGVYHVAVSEEGYQVPLPFQVRLEAFRIDYYDDGVSVKQYTSDIAVDGQTKTTSVNHPCWHKGYWIYQAGYDEEGGRYTVLKVVRDPWVKVVYIGMVLMMLSAVMELKRTWRSKVVTWAIVLLAVVFMLLSVAKIHFGTLMPALRSFWFVPHLIVYMLAYAVMAVSLVMGVASIWSKRIEVELSQRLLTTASSLLLIGMLCGAVWAKMAWGDYWSWDAKENWAAVTWLLTLVCGHLPGSVKSWVRVAVVAVAFAAIQVTWYGVQYLPAAEESMHVYNR